MIELNNFELNKLYGYIYALCNCDEKALEYFEAALKEKEDGQTYYQMAYSYTYLKDYINAQRCALKAIELGYDAYELYIKITWGNLRDYGAGKKVLLDGYKKRSSSACILLSDDAEFFEVGDMLEKAYEYARPNEKGNIAYIISKKFKRLEKEYPDFYKKDRASYYLKIFNDYGGSLSSAPHLNILLFNEAIEKNDRDIIQILFDRFDSDAKIIFLFMLLEMEYKKKSNLYFEKDTPCYALISYLAKNENNQITKLLKSYMDFESSNEMQEVINMNRASNLIIPEYYKKPFDMFLDDFFDLMLESETDLYMDVSLDADEA